MISTFIFCLCLFLAIWFTIITIVRVYYKQILFVPPFALAAAWTGVITHLMHI